MPADRDFVLLGEQLQYSIYTGQPPIVTINLPPRLTPDRTEISRTVGSPGCDDRLLLEPPYLVT